MAWIVALALVALFAASCTVSATVEQTASEAGASDSVATEASGDDTTTSPNDSSPDDSSPSDSMAGDEESATVEPTALPAAEPTEGPAEEPPGDSSTNDSPTQDTDADDAPLAVGEARVVLLDPGAEPRTELRLDIAASCTELMTVTSVQEISQQIDGEQIPEAGPLGNVMEMETSAAPVGDNYEIRAEIISAVSTPDTPQLLAANIDLELAALVGVTTYSTLTNRGVQVPGSSRVEGAEALGPMASIIEALSQAQSPLPEEAVGVGARWETISLLELEGLRLTTIATIELVSIDGTVLELNVTGRQEVDPDSRMQTQGVTGEVTEWEVVSYGTTVVDLATINPISSSVSTEGVQGFDFGFGGELVQELSSQFTIEAQPNDGCTGRTIRS